MNFDIDARTILLVNHGSHAYGLNTPTSDRDYKGVCIEPKPFYYGFLHHFEQFEHMGSKTDGIDKVVYSLKKFASLAADCNPSIIEVLWVDDTDILMADQFGTQLRNIRRDFISKKARWTFSGYAIAQLKRIKTHRQWLLNPPKNVPTRGEFGLSETSKVSKSELGAYDAAQKDGIELELSKELLTVFTREKQWQSAKQHYEQYVNWTKTRNPARAEMEAKFGYDVKHGMHLCRLMRMCKEILVTGEVLVKRPDREELLAIRNGEWSYDRLIEFAEKAEAECAALYETSTLRKEPDRVKLDSDIVDMIDRYVGHYG